MNGKTISKPNDSSPTEPTRRDFIVLTASAVAGIGACVAAWPLIDSLNPSADVLAVGSIEVDLSPIQVGQIIKVTWRGVPVFIRHRTAEDVADARSANINELIDPEEDEKRVKEGYEQWLVVVGVCTHLGCIPIFNTGTYKDGWFCPCHGSQYDSSGRVRRGPAPKSLAVPPSTFLNDTNIKIG